MNTSSTINFNELEKQFQENKKQVEEAVEKLQKSVQDKNILDTVSDTDTLDQDGYSVVNNPSHYQSMEAGLNIDAITCMQAAFGNTTVASFCICNALKYIFRHESKGGKTDIQKAIWYLNKYLTLL